MHTQFKTPDGKDVIVVEVPQVLLIIEVHKGLIVMGITRLDVDNKKIKINRGDRRGFINIGFGYEPIGLHTEITEEQAKGLAIPLWGGYRNHDTIDDGTVGNYKRFVTYSPIESLYSRLRSLGLDPDNKKYFLLINHK